MKHTCTFKQPLSQRVCGQPANHEILIQNGFSTDSVGAVCDVHAAVVEQLVSWENKE